MDAGQLCGCVLLLRRDLTVGLHSYIEGPKSFLLTPFYTLCQHVMPLSMLGKSIGLKDAKARK